MPLVALALAFLLTFAWQRNRSGFLAIEARRPAAAQLADRHGLTVPDVLALHDFVGSSASNEVWADAVRRMAARMRAEQLANAGVYRAGEHDAGDAHLGDVAAALAASGADATAVRRFRLLRERFAARR